MYRNIPELKKLEVIFKEDFVEKTLLPFLETDFYSNDRLVLDFTNLRNYDPVFLDSIVKQMALFDYDSILRKVIVTGIHEDWEKYFKEKIEKELIKNDNMRLELDFLLNLEKPLRSSLQGNYAPDKLIEGIFDLREFIKKEDNIFLYHKKQWNLIQSRDLNKISIDNLFRLLDGRKIRTVKNYNNFSLEYLGDLGGRRIRTIEMVGTGFEYQGPRKKYLGLNSAEAFIKDILDFDVVKDDIIYLDFKDTKVYTNSFLSELISYLKEKNILKNFKFINMDLEWYNYFKEYL